MKIRIKKDSVRFSLTRSDVKQLAVTGGLEEKIDLGSHSLTYAIRLTDDKKLSSDYSNHTITLFMPESMISELTNSDKTSFENNDGRLQLLVKKDFDCLNINNESQSDNFANPSAEKFYEEEG